MPKVKQIWETDRDRDRELEIAEFFARLWKCRLEKIDGHHEIDFTFHRSLSEDVTFYGECRYKDHDYRAFPDVFCGVKKLHWADAQRAHGLQTRFLVRWKCGTHGYTNLQAPDRIIYGGRSKGKMRNGEDREPLGIYNIDRFRIVKDEREESIEGA